MLFEIEKWYGVYAPQRGDGAQGIHSSTLLTTLSAAERQRNNLNGLKVCRNGNDSSQGHDLALTGLFVSSSLDGGTRYGLRFTDSPSLPETRYTRYRSAKND